MAEPTQTDAQALHDEQIRLRTEVELLRSQHEELQRQLANQASHSQEKKPDDQQNQDDQKNGDKHDKDKEQEDKKPKESNTTRARNWAKAHRQAVVWGVIGLLVLLAAGYLLLTYLESYENTDDAQVDGHTDPVSSRISGDVVGVYVENTQRVRKGQITVDLDPRDYEVALAQARANLSQAEASLKAQSPNVPITATTQETLAERRNWK